MSSSGFREQLNGEIQRSMTKERQRFQDGDLERGEYLDKLTEHGLESRSAEYLNNMLSPDFVMSKITSAEKEEMRWLIREQAEKINAMHPPKRSPVQGKHMAAMYDDEDALWTALTDRQIQLLEMAVWDIFFRIARSEGGWQQQELSSQYNVSRVDDGKDDNNSRLGGLFG